MKWALDVLTSSTAAPAPLDRTGAGAAPVMGCLLLSAKLGQRLGRPRITGTGVCRPAVGSARTSSLRHPRGRLLRVYAVRPQAAFARALDGAPNAGEGLCRYLDMAAGQLTKDGRGGCPIAPTALEVSHLSPRLRAAAAHCYLIWEDTSPNAFEPMDGRRSRQSRQPRRPFPSSRVHCCSPA
jgi:hypothetical protein